jgi:lysine 2,3-aminomutase
MEGWEKSLASSIVSPEALAKRFSIDPELLKPVVGRYPMRITPYYLDLIQEIGDPVWRQCVPDLLELESDHHLADPLNEEGSSPVPGLIHRYPDRVVLLISSTCATLCRFCVRKSWIQSQRVLNTDASIETALQYIERTPAIRDVILSGGDPFLLSDDYLESVLIKLRKIPHLEIIRIGTRAPVTLPERITPRLCRMLKKFHPLYVNTHFNHPMEITSQSAGSCARLVNAGIPLGNQTVLLKGVNDSLEVMKELVQELLTIRVRPYYLHHMDRAKGTSHFRTSVDQGIKIMAGLRGHTSGIAIPYYMIDLPGGKGKVPVLPDDVKRQEKIIYLRNYLGEVVEYPEGDGED